MRWLGRWLLVLGALTASACSLETAINAMTSAEDRQFAQDFVANVKSGNEAWLAARTDPQLRADIGAGLKQAAAAIPPDPSTTRLVAYHVATNSVAGGASTRRQRFTLVTEGGGRWSVTEFETLAEGGPARIVAWRVMPRATRPPELEAFELSERMVPWIWATLAGLAAVLVGILWAYLRYRRRKREARRP